MERGGSGDGPGWVDDRVAVARRQVKGMVVDQKGLEQQSAAVLATESGWKQVGTARGRIGLIGEGLEQQLGAVLAAGSGWKVVRTAGG